jgi:type IV secretory pathway protease TraF
MNSQSVASLDGRYFGPLPTTTIVGRADPIWIEEAQ